jgi:hypothetical protein
MMERHSRADAETLLRRCLEDGQVIPSKHFRDGLFNEGLDLLDALCVLKGGQIYNEPEPDVRTREWKYTVEGSEPGGRWLAIVFCFKRTETVLLITVFSVKARSRQ